MREIKFRAWDMKYRKMFQNGVFKEALDGLRKVAKLYVPNLPIGESGLYLPLEDGNMIFMQYTGLKDKNGKEIYEGDLLGGDWLTAPVVVKWHENGHWVVEGLNGWDEHLCAYKDIAVVGNIYEHEHLLEPKGIVPTE